MRPVYSERFLQTSFAGGWTPYWCPAGYRAVLRCITAANGGATPSEVTVTANGAAVWVASVPALSTRTAGELTVVIYATEQYQVYIDAAGPHVTLHGWLLTETGGRSGPIEGVTPLPMPSPPELRANNS